MTPANLPALLQRFFTDRLCSQLGASQHTVASYRDAFRLLLVFSAARLKRPPNIGDVLTWSDLRIEIVDMDGPRIDRLLISTESQPQPESEAAAGDPAA